MGIVFFQGWRSIVLLCITKLGCTLGIGSDASRPPAVSLSVLGKALYCYSSSRGRSRVVVEF
jgi:hypothetical protein